jgi:hypothetical protein
MAGLFVLFCLFLLVAVMFMHYGYERRNKQTSVPRKDLLLGYDFSQGSPWKSSSMTKETGKNQLKVVEESHNQDGLEKIFRAPTDEGIEKKDIGTIVVEDNNPTDEDVEKKEVVAIIVEDDSPTDENVGKDVEGKMRYPEFQKLLLQADSLSASCTPQKSDYGRGYHMGVQIHFNNTQPGSLPDHYSIAEIARSIGCRNVHAFARGYLNGYMGLKPEYNG